jgi:hypothetical protein
MSLAALAASGVYSRYRIVERLNAAEAELDTRDPGWRIDDIEAARATIPDSKNSAPRVLAAAQWLPSPWPPSQHTLLPLLHLAPGERPDPGLVAALRNELAECQIALDEARPLADQSTGRYSITYPRLLTNSDEMPQHPEVIVVGHLLCCDALLNALDDNPSAAMRSCRACLNAARSIGDEPLTIPQLYRCMGVTAACRIADQTLGLGEPSPDDLASLQRLLEDEDAFPRMMVALRGERACLHQMFDLLCREPTLDEAEMATDTTDRLKEFVWGSNRQSEHSRMLTLMTLRMETTERSPIQSLAAEERTADTEFESLPPLEVPFIRKEFRSLDEVSGAFRMMDARLRCLIACLATERFRRARGFWPEKLTDLVPTMLSAVPIDPYDGQPLRYRRSPDGVLVYSVGPDGEDNGGNVKNSERFWPGFDLGIRLLDVANRGRQRDPTSGPTP